MAKIGFTAPTPRACEEIDDADDGVVHGNGNKIAEGPLKLVWDTALFGEDMGAPTRMAYWRPLRDPSPLPEASPVPDEIGVSSQFGGEGRAPAPA